jgi:hypothetical protein
MQPGDPAWLDALGRGGRGRVAPADRGLRAVHQAVQSWQTATSFVSMMPVRSPLLTRSLCGPARHRVRISGETTVYAMCAIGIFGPLLASPPPDVLA